MTAKQTKRVATVGAIAGVLLLAIALLASPLAAAMGYGVGARGVSELTNAGAKPQYSQIWITAEVGDHGWSVIESQLKTARDAGITPVVLWYYWGDSISVSAVQYGKDGRTRDGWNRLTNEMLTRVNSIMGSKSFFLVLEPEFNKNGISDWETFDGYLESQAKLARSKAPGAKIVTGFGHWGGFEKFDRAVAASDYAGTQMMRASTRDSSSEGENVATQVVNVANKLKSLFGKPIILYDLAVSSYGSGWETVQERAIQGFADKEDSLEAAGVRAVVWRTIVDDDYSAGYFGEAERYWGVKHRSGSAKPAWNNLVDLVRSGSGTTSTATTTVTPTTPTTSTSPTSSPSIPTNPFSDVKGNAWWIQAEVAGSPSKVEAKVGAGVFIALSLAWWGDYTVSTRAPEGSLVTLRATYPGGVTREATYKWTSATLVSTGTSSTSTTTTPTTSTTTTSTTAAGDASFANVKGNAWWVQVDVKSAAGVRSVEARVNDGAWTTLTKQWWGSWAKSIRAPDGSTVQFRATLGDGSTDYSGRFEWIP